MKNDALGNMMEQTMSDLKGVVDGETVLGKEIYAPDGTTVIPVSKVSFGLVTGGGEYGIQRLSGDFSGIGAGGAGATITPIGFLLLGKSSHSFIKIDGKEEDEKWINVLQSIAHIFTKKNHS